MKVFGDAINQLIQRENERVTVRRKGGKHKVKRIRNKPRAPRQLSALSSASTPLPSHALNDLNRFSSLLPNNSSSVLSNPFAGLQSSMPPTATRNPSAPTATKRAENSTLAGLLAPNPPGVYSTVTGMSTSNGTSQYGKQYGPDDCFLSTKASKFWCFQQGVERVREYMIQQMESTKSIWFTEFGFSSFAGWDGAGIQSQADYLGRAIDIIRNQWPFVHSACVYEYSDYGPADDREGFFGLLYQNYTMKPSGVIFQEKMKHLVE